MPTEVDCAYTAGTVDGEGCISLCKNGNDTFFLRAIVAMNNHDIVEWLHSTFMGSVYQVKDSRATRRSNWRWEICGNKCASFLGMILPYLKVKYEQAELGIKFQQRRRYNHRSIPRTTNEVLQDIADFNQMRLLNLTGRGKGALVAPPNF